MTLLRKYSRILATSRNYLAAIAIASCLAGVSRVQASNSWDGGGNSNWWFNPVNWSDPNNYLPPYQSADGLNNPYPVANDVQINNGWNVASGGEGVVYDPVNDPFQAAVASATYFSAPFDANRGGVLNRLYISRNTTLTNILTIKSGAMSFEARPADANAPTIGTNVYSNAQTTTVIIGRSGSTLAAQNLGMVVQKGGVVSFPTSTVDMGQRETSGWGNGTWDYQGGTLDVSATSGAGLRLSAGSTTAAGQVGAGGVGKFIMHNPASGGHVQTFDFVFSSAAGIDEGVQNDPSDSVYDPLVDANGTTNGVSIAEFHFENGKTRPIQVTRNLSINNGVDQNTKGIRSARLDLKLDAAPLVTAGIPQNLGLFDVNFGGTTGGAITGSGDLNNDAIFNNDRVFSNVGNTGNYREGDMVSAIFGSTKYNWTISYTGDIQWTDAANSVVNTITGPTTGVDVVLLGLSTETVAVPDDANFDGIGKVDGVDFLTWQRNSGTGTTFAQGDADHDGSVTSADLAIWKTQFGTSGGGNPIGGVPEPGSAALLAIACAALAARRRRA